MFPTHDLLSILFYQRNCGTEKVSACQFAILLNIETALKIVECENEKGEMEQK